MKARRTIYVILGVLCLIWNIAIWMSCPSTTGANDLPEKIGRWTGKFILSGIGILFLRSAWRIDRTLKRHRLEKLADFMGEDATVREEKRIS